MLERESSFIRKPLPRCAVLIDRHVHKNGGTSMRAILLENDFADAWAYWGYGCNRMASVASAIAATLGNETSCADRTSRTPLRIAAELHYNNALSGLHGSLLLHFGPASPLRRIIGGPPCSCKVVLVTRLRDTLSFYRSFWHWSGVDRKQNASSHRFGSTMLEWAHAFRNLQSTLILSHVNAAVAPQYLAIREARAAASYGPFWCFDEAPMLKNIPAAVRSDCDRSGGLGASRLATLRRGLAAFDVVGLLERFDETLLMVSDAAGLQELLHPPVRDVRSAPLRTSSARLAKALGCASEAACHAAIRAAAPVDDLVYREAREAFDLKVSRLGPNFGRRVAALRLARQARLAQERWMARKSGARGAAYLRQWQQQQQPQVGGLQNRSAAATPALRVPKAKRARLATPAVRDARKLAQLPPRLAGDGSRAYCRGMMRGDGGEDAAEICRLVHADNLFAFPWRPWESQRVARGGISTTFALEDHASE